MSTSFERMAADELYNPLDAELAATRLRARELFRRLNNSEPEDVALRPQLVAELIATGGDTAWIEPPFHCDYGRNITHIQISGGVN